MPAASPKLDLYKRHKADYAAPKKPALLRPEAGAYLAIEGRGAPGGDRFSAAVAALYAVAFTVKMARKAAGDDYSVAMLEGLWWAPGGGCDLSAAPPDEWNWKLLIRTPEFVTPAEVEKAAKSLLAKGKPEDVARVRLETLDEGECVQMLHTGPYANEAVTIASMRAFAEGRGKTPHGPHHEIYLSDPRRVPPERLQTILRLPVR